MPPHLPDFSRATAPSLQVLRPYEDFLQQAKATPQAKALTKALSQALHDITARQATWAANADAVTFLNNIACSLKMLSQLCPGQLLLSPPLADSFLSRDRRHSVALLLHAVVAGKAGKGSAALSRNCCAR